MSFGLDRVNGYIKPEEFNATLGGLMDKLVDSPLSRVMSHPSLVSPLAEFVALAGSSYSPSTIVQTTIREAVEGAIIRTVICAQGNEESGKFEPLLGMDDGEGSLCEWGIIAHQLHISYSLEPSSLDVHPLITARTNRDISTLLNFEFYHFDYEGELADLGKFLPLDIIYFAQLNGIIDSLERKTMSDLDVRCAMPTIRKATVDESQQRLAEMKAEMEQKKRLGEYVKKGDELAIEFFEEALHGVPNPRSQLRINWINAEGVTLCYPDVTRSIVPRRSYSLAEIKDCLGPKLESGLGVYCDVPHERKNYDDVTAILYRRNRVKAFLGSDIKIPLSLASHDDDSFTTMDPTQIRQAIDCVVDAFGPNNIYSPLALPINLTPKEYRLYRTICTTMGYVRRGSLTYDTPEKKALLSGSQIPSLAAVASLLMLPAPDAEK